MVFEVKRSVSRRIPTWAQKGVTPQRGIRPTSRSQPLEICLLFCKRRLASSGSNGLEDNEHYAKTAHNHERYSYTFALSCDETTNHCHQNRETTQGYRQSEVDEHGS